MDFSHTKISLRRVLSDYSKVRALYGRIEEEDVSFAESKSPYSNDRIGGHVNTSMPTRLYGTKYGARVFPWQQPGEDSRANIAVETKMQ
jgi:hypothetical protein